MYLKLQNLNKYESTILNLNLPVFVIQDLNTCSIMMRNAFYNVPAWRVRIYTEYPYRIELMSPSSESTPDLDKYAKEYREFSNYIRYLEPDHDFKELLINSSDNFQIPFQNINWEKSHKFIKQKEEINVLLEIESNQMIRTATDSFKYSDNLYG